MNALLIASEEAGNGFWLPHDINEVIWGTLAFIIVIGLLVWKAGPAIKTALAARPERIAAELEAASSARADAEARSAEVKTALADSDNEAARIIAEGEVTAKRLSTDLMARAESDAQLIRDRASAEIATARRQAQADLAGEISRLALGAAEQVVHSNLDDSTQQSLIEGYISQVGSNN